MSIHQKEPPRKYFNQFVTQFYERAYEAITLSSIVAIITILSRLIMLLAAVVVAAASKADDGSGCS